MEKFNQIIGKENKKSPEMMVDQLKKLLIQVSENINSELREYFPNTVETINLVNEAGVISEELYKADLGGPISLEQIEKYQQFVETRERDWSAFDDEKVRQFYAERYGSQTDEEFMQAWHNERIKSNGSLAEMAVTVLLHKFLKDDFYVLRTNPYDDYAHGVDNFIVEKNTGVVVCTFDEFFGSVDDDRFHKKLDRERRQATKHGATITYGLGVQYSEDNKKQIIPQTIRNVPTFTLPINKEQCLALIDDLGEDLEQEVGDVSSEVFKHIISSMVTQAEYFKVDLLDDSPVLARVNEFMSALIKIQAKFTNDLK